MVDPVGAKPVTVNDRRVAPVATQPVSPKPEPAPVSSNAAQPQVASGSLGTVVRAAATQPPVQQDRVTLIRQAIAAGLYPILPETIADRLIAIKLNWTPNDPS